MEQAALELATGKILDVGAGAGSHSLYLQDERRMNVTALDISPKSVEVCKERGISKSVCKSVLDFSDEKFDTILLLMNGTGILKAWQRLMYIFRS